MTTPLTANQLVGYNLMRIRKAHGLSQQEASDQLEPYLPGKRWSKTVYSAAERSYHGARIRQFDGDELLAMALAFSVPVAYFLLPPRPEDRPTGAVVVSGYVEVPWWQMIPAGQCEPEMLMRLRELPAGERSAMGGTPA
jgi:hypothetical protein